MILLAQRRDVYFSFFFVFILFLPLAFLTFATQLTFIERKKKGKE